MKRNLLNLVHVAFIAFVLLVVYLLLQAVIASFVPTQRNVVTTALPALMLGCLMRRYYHKPWFYASALVASVLIGSALDSFLEGAIAGVALVCGFLFLPSHRRQRESFESQPCDQANQ